MAANKKCKFLLNKNKNCTNSLMTQLKCNFNKFFDGNFHLTERN